jgi:tRNA U38,U39,U40 pseudouridine synthase TruA
MTAVTALMDLSMIIHFHLYVQLETHSVPIIMNCSGDVMVRVHASSAVDRGFNPRSGQTKDYRIGICCFSAKHTALTRKSKDWLAQNQDNVSEWSNMSNRGLLFQ